MPDLLDWPQGPSTRDFLSGSKAIGAWRFLFLSSFKVKNEWSPISTSHLPSWHAQWNLAFAITVNERMKLIKLL